MTDKWAQPSRLSRRHRTAFSQEEESVLSRSLAVFIAVPLFEFSLYLGLVLLVVSPRLAAYIWTSLPWLFHVIYCAVVVLVASWYGMHGITQLLGHLFLTHHEAARDRRITVGLWSALGLVTLIAYILRE